LARSGASLPVDSENHHQEDRESPRRDSLTPEQAGSARLLELVRCHWYIENRSYWVRDVTFGEDHSQVRCGNIPQVMAALRNLVIGLMRWLNIAAACRYFAAQPWNALEAMGIRN